MSDSLYDIACPNCAQPLALAQHGPEVQCAACHQQFILAGHLCPFCHAYHAEETSFCGRCGQALRYRCADCAAVNWAGDEVCRQCGRPVDIFDRLQRHHTDSHRDFFERRREEIQEIKSREAAGSQARMDTFISQDQAHLAQIQERRQQDQRRERILVFATIAALGTCLLTIVLVFLIQAVFSTG